MALHVIKECRTISFEAKVFLAQIIPNDLKIKEIEGLLHTIKKPVNELTFPAYEIEIPLTVGKWPHPSETVNVD